METFKKYWYVWGLLLLIIGFLVALNWKKWFGKTETTVQKLLKSCRQRCNDNYATSVNGCNQYTGTVKQHCLQIAGMELDKCLGKCK